MDGFRRGPGILGMNIRLAVPLLGSFFTCAALACTTTTTTEGTPGGGSSSSSTSSSGSTDTPVDESTCIARCEDKLESCEVPASDATRACSSFCASGPTAKELACAEDASCEALLTADSVDELCGGTTSSSSGGSSGGSSSGGSSSGGTSSSGSSSGGTSKPTSLKITAKKGSGKATHILSSDQKQIISAISIGGAPSFSPTKPSELPNVTKPKAVSVSSPALGSCKPNMSFTLNGSQVAVVITATDVLPATDCATWTDKIASSGLEVSLDDVPYPNGGTADVDIDWSP